MKIKILVCVATALLICSAASADYLQIAQEAAVNGAAGADEMLEYVYNSGAARDPKEEIRRLYIWDYLLELKKQEADLISDVYYTAYTELNRSGELDYLAELADRYSRRAGELTEELNRNYAHR